MYYCLLTVAFVSVFTSAETFVFPSGFVAFFAFWTVLVVLFFTAVVVLAEVVWTLSIALLSSICTDASVFNENQVREAITMERGPTAREDYLEKLRNESYIKISENYREGLTPLLKLKPDSIVETTADAQARPLEKKPKGKFLKIFPKP